MNDRERLIDILYEGFYISPGNDMKGTVQKAAEYLISNGVTVQKRGRWEQSEFDLTMDRVVCSHCKKEWNVIDNCTETFKYCPNCGAKMDGEA